jgi:hypothetical protein
MANASEHSKDIRRLVQEQRDAANEPTVAARLAGCLIISARLQEYLQVLSNAQIAEVMSDLVWSEMDSYSPEAIITAEAISRLSGSDDEESTHSD